MNKKVLLATFFAACVIFVFFQLILNKNKNVEKTPQIDKSEHFVGNYESGFNRGYNAFMAQMGEESSEKRVFKYTKFEKEIENSEEEELKGYVDGYHKAAELQYCPRP